MQYTLTTYPTDRNRDEFYRMLYRVQNLPKDQLIDLGDLDTSCPILIIDSCGWYYRQHFPGHDITVIESVTVCKDYRLGLDRFDKMFDNRNQQMRWPRLPVIDPVLILDQSPLLFKYQAPGDVPKALEPMISLYRPREIRMRVSLVTLDDPRFCDRVQHITSMIPPGYVVSYLEYDPEKLRLDLKRKREIDWPSQSS